MTSCPSRRRTTCRWRSSTRSLPFLIIAGAVLLHRRGAEQGAGAQRQPRRDDRGQRLQVELAVRLPGHHRCRTASRSARSATAPRSRSWCCRPTGRSASRSQSADVIHSFWVPEFLFKLDVIPGNDNGRDNVFEVTVREEGSYVGRCAELCGTYHAFMNFEVRAVSGDDYDAYLEARESGMTTSEALEEIGQPGLATATTPFDRCRTATSSRPTVAEPAHRPEPNRLDARGGTAVKVESLIFSIIALFCVAAAVVYGFWAQEPDRDDGPRAVGRPHRPDRRLLLVRLATHRRPPRGPQGRRDRRRAPASWASSARRATGRSRWRCPPR